jgi:hypothetical protein
LKLQKKQMIQTIAIIIIALAVDAIAMSNSSQLYHPLFK